ncbi:MAG TPA: PAS domain-containing protein, partial [Deltaproteobacteria bacterium]|nr:PAS domain-containing protein [Deltaproteobacteria bacterium]
MFVKKDAPFPEQADMGVWWLGTHDPPGGTDLCRASSLEETGEDDLVFVENPRLLGGASNGARRIYLVAERPPRRRLAAGIMGCIPPDPSVIASLAQLYNEMKQSFEVGDMLISSLNEKDRVIREKHRLMVTNARRYNAIIQNANDIIFVVGPAGKITFCNDTFTRCLSPQDISPVGRLVSLYVVEEDREQLQQALDKGFSAGSPVRAEVRMKLRSGRTGIISLLCAPLEESGRVYALSVIGRDITELRAMQKRLTIQAADLSQMMNGLAHELRNPLTVIGAYVRRLARERADRSDKWEEALGGIYSSIRRIETMIERVEGYERLVNMQPCLTHVDLRPVVE